MKLRKLARLCEHDEFKRHYYPKGLGNTSCPGGVFLPEDTLDLDALTEAFTASEGIFHQEEGWAELNDHGIRIFDAALEYLKLFRGSDALDGETP